MHKMGSTKHWLVTVVVAALALAATACGGEEPPTIVGGSNACGGEDTLEYEGEEAEPDDACGECGVLVCDGENALTCEDPGENACGGCQELDARPGNRCTTDGGEDGLWECDGGDAVQCVEADINACGGTEPLDAQPGESCGACLLDTYECDGINTVSCTEQIGCPQPGDVNASQGEHADGVRVTWRGSIHAESYRIYRDDEEIAVVSPGQLSYMDEDAEPAAAPEDVNLEASDDQTDGVHLQWNADEGSVVEHDYQVEIVFPEETSGPSVPATGWRGADIDHYELSVDGGERVYTLDDTTFVDEDADYATVDDATPQVDDAGWDYISLGADPTVVDADEHHYEVVVVLADGDESNPGEATGKRAHGDADYTWSVSTDGSDFQEMTDCAGDTECTDDDFPVDSDIYEKWYRFTVDGDGIEETSETIDAQVEMLDVAPGETGDLMIGETTTITAQIISPDDGSDVAREGVELHIDISHEDALVGDVPGPVTTGADGSAQADVTFDQQADDVVISWTAVDPRVVDDTVSAQPFDVVASPADGDLTSMVALDTTEELLADDDEYTIVEIEVRDGNDEPISGAAVDAGVDSGATLFDCDQFTDADGLAQCSIRADEPGSYNVELTAPASMTLEDVGPFYATADDYAAVSGDIADVAVVGDLLVVVGDGIDADGADYGAGVVVDRISGQPVGELDDDFTEIYAAVADGDDLFVAGDDDVARYALDNGALALQASTGEFLGELLVVEGDYVVVFEADNGDAEALDRDDLTTDGSTFDLFDSAQVDAVQSANGTAYALGSFDPLLQTEYNFASYSIPGLNTDEYLEVGDVEDGDIQFFDVGDGTAHFVAGDFTDIDEQGVAQLARLDDEGNVDAGFAPIVLPDVDGGLFYTDGLVWSAGLIDGAGGNAYDAATGDLVAGHGLDNDYAWGAIADAPRYFVLFADVDGEDPSVDFEMVIRPDVDNQVISD